ncbi:MAG TPA: hypothetical protein VFM74_06185, partial [Candidatus Limnocylindria bacterium]|nr:hypothetical protein [Candidatus Limnocylindria bacterium]
MPQINLRPMARLSTVGISIALALVPATAMAMHFSAWGMAVPETGINSPQADGCPIESPDGLELYIASNRGGGGDPNDIWVAHRDSIGGPWSTPANLGAPVNSPAADFCPTPLRGNRLLFVSTRAGADACGTAPAGDIYLARRNPHHGWGTPLHLGCDADGTGPNFPGAEFGPSLVETAEGTFLYFSSNGYGGDQDIYASRMRSDGSFGPASVVQELSTAADDFMPNVRKDGLEIVFNSNRPGSTLNTAGLPSQDVYTATRASTADAWSAPINLGPAVNTAGNETRSSLSGDGRRLHFGRDGDIFVSE